MLYGGLKLPTETTKIQVHHFSSQYDKYTGQEKSRPLFRRSWCPRALDFSRKISRSFNISLSFSFVLPTRLKLDLTDLIWAPELLHLELKRHQRVTKFPPSMQTTLRSKIEKILETEYRYKKNEMKKKIKNEISWFEVRKKSRCCGQ